uniref:Putative ovule protein n=1 Tax=Solanum chacoense TaxID=4108 RepID=A0A0V0GSE4_SOLCH
MPSSNELLANSLTFIQPHCPLRKVMLPHLRHPLAIDSHSKVPLKSLGSIFNFCFDILASILPPTYPKHPTYFKWPC